MMNPRRNRFRSCSDSSFRSTVTNALGGCALNQLFFRQFQELNDLNARHGWVVVEEFINRGSAFDVVQQVLNGNASSLETGNSTQPFRVHPDDLVKLGSLLQVHIVGKDIFILAQPVLGTAARLYRKGGRLFTIRTVSTPIRTTWPASRTI